MTTIRIAAGEMAAAEAGVTTGREGFTASANVVGNISESL
jgi:hypothetical protein